MQKETLKPCPCGLGSDNTTYFHNDDGTIGYHCFRGDCAKPKGLLEGSPTKADHVTDYINKADLDYRPHRNISKETLEVYGIKSTSNLDLYIPVYDTDGEVHFKVRNNTTDKNKKWSWEGTTPAGRSLKLTGQQAFEGKSGKYITVVSGTLDAPSVYEMNGGWPCVSVDADGRALQQCTENWDFLNQYENIIFAFDNDGPAQKVVTACAELFPGKSKVMRLKYKDANEYLTKKKQKEWRDDWWNARSVTVKGILRGKDFIDALKNRVAPECFDYPWGGLNKLTYGYRMGEMVILGAGTKQGKTLFMTHIADHILKTTDFNIGVIFLEDPTQDAMLRFASVRGQVPFHLPDVEYDELSYHQAIEETLGSDRLFFYNNDEFAGNTTENMLAKIQQFVKAYNCKVIFLDHISFLVGIDSASGDERRKLDEMATKLKSMTVNLDFTLFAAAHFKRLPGTPHEEGAESSISDFRSSGIMGQLCNIAIGLERNQQADDPTERATSKVRVLANRFVGRSGVACELLYSEYPFTWNEIKDD